MARKSELAKAEAELRKAALAYPQSVEEFPWDHRAIKVKGKIFLILAREAKTPLRVTVKLPVSNRYALTLPFCEPTGYGLGKSGWVTATFGPDEPVPLDLLADWIDESYRAVAPKKLVESVEAADAPAPPPRKGRGGR
jgi:predicted DNA-binding protein (MmcQ/YjbR family)